MTLRSNFRASPPPFAQKGDIKTVVAHFRQRVKLMVMAGVRVVIVLDKVGDYNEKDGSVPDGKKAENERYCI